MTRIILLLLIAASAWGQDLAPRYFCPVCQKEGERGAPWWYRRNSFGGYETRIVKVLVLDGAGRIIGTERHPAYTEPANGPQSTTGDAGAVEIYLRELLTGRRGND